MRKTLITLAAIGGAYLLYKIWKTQKDKAMAQSSSTIIEETIEKAKANDANCKTPICDNRRVFKSMRGQFNSEESATVAPSINAKIGIF